MIWRWGGRRAARSRRLAEHALQVVAWEFGRVTGATLPMRVELTENGVTLGVTGEDWYLGTRVDFCRDPDDALWLVADVAQDLFIERYRAFWPECVQHGTPLSPAGIEDNGAGTPWWVCRLTKEHHAVRPIGDLTADDARFTPGSFRGP